MSIELLRIEQEIAERTALFIEQRDKVIADGLSNHSGTQALAVLKSYADDISKLQDRYNRIVKIDTLLE